MCSSVVLAYMMKSSSHTYFGASADETNHLSPLFFINALIIYLLLLIATQFSQWLDFHYPMKSHWRRRSVTQIVYGTTLPIVFGLCCVLLYVYWHKIGLSGVLNFSGYLGKLTLLLLAVNAFDLFLAPSNSALDQIRDGDSAHLFEPGNPTNFNDIALAFRKNGEALVSNFLSEITSWSGSRMKDLHKLAGNDFYALSDDLIVNKRAITSVRMDHRKATILLIGGFEIIHAFENNCCIEFQNWLANETYSNKIMVHA